MFMFFLLYKKKLGKTWNTLHNFCPDFSPIYSLEKVTLVAESQRQSVDLSWPI